MRKGHTLLGLLFFLLFSLPAQNTVQLSGIIKGVDFKPLVSASIYVEQFTNGALSDSTGHFTIKVATGGVDVGFSYVGHTPQQFHFNLQHDTVIEIVLEPMQLAELTIVEQREFRESGHYDNGIIVMRREEFTRLPAFLGEHDPIRAVQMQPGIQSGNEGSRGIFVRGGSPDQNLLLVDGAPVYNPSHIYGFISVFNGDAIDRVEIHKSDYPSRFGGRLCSVLDITMDEGNNQNIRGSVTVGLVTSRLHLEGPLTKKKKTTFSFSARGCYVGLYSSPISKRQYRKSGYDGDVSYYFADVNLKVAHAFSETSKLEFTFFNNSDFYKFLRVTSGVNMDYRFDGHYAQNLRWANYAASAAWKLKLGRRWKLTNRVIYSRYQLQTDRDDNYSEHFVPTGEKTFYSNFTSTLNTHIQELGYKFDIVRVARFQTFRAGAGASWLNYQTGKGSSALNDIYTGESSGTLAQPPYNPFEFYMYLEDELHPAEKWTINFGVHARLYAVQKETFTSFLPRLNAVFNSGKGISLRTSVSALSQNMHLLTTSSSDILNDYWVPATASAPPETGWNFSLGIQHKLPLGFEWSVDGFWRIMRNLIDYKPGGTYASATSRWDEQIVTGGRGRAYGGEFYIARSKGKITGSVAYTLCWSQRRFNELNNGDYFSFKYDRRHNIAAQVNYNISKHFEVGVAWVYGSGNMFTLPLHQYISAPGAWWYDYQASQGYRGYAEKVTVYTEKNGYRLPAFHHLDVSFTYKKQSKKCEHLLNVSVYNVYNRFNIFSVYSDYRPADDGSRRLVYKKLSLFPVMPSLSYTIKFHA